MKRYRAGGRGLDRLMGFMAGGVDAIASFAARSVGGRKRRGGKKRRVYGRRRKVSAFNRRVAALTRKHPGMSLGQASKRASRSY